VSEQPEVPVSKPEAGPETVLPSTGVGSATIAEPDSKKRFFWGVGRRKSSVARVRLRPGKGDFKVNDREIDVYFTELRDRQLVVGPLKATETLGKVDVYVNVQGGGFAGQAGAIVLGVARALKVTNPDYEAALRDNGYLTRDSRMVERKKYGQRGARRRFQFSKR
jgi:small subunit ribosomal protein S9